MKTLFIVLSSIFLMASALPYIRDILKGTTKPRVVSWFNWGLLAGIAGAAALADRQYVSVILSFTIVIQSVIIVTLGYRKGDRKFEPLDAYCQLGAVVGLVLWALFNSPLLALIAVVAVDFIAGIPTIKHAWQKPHEETLATYVLAGIGGIFSVLALNDPAVSGMVYPIFVVVMSFLFSAQIYLRQRVQ